MGSGPSVVEHDEDAFSEAMEAVVVGIDALSEHLSATDVVRYGLEAVIDPLRPYLGAASSVDDLIRFLPDGGSLAGLLRALSPAIDLEDGAGHLPLDRHGSTTLGQVATAEAVASAAAHGAVILVDDFGDNLDVATAQRMAKLLRSSSGQVWLSTRRAETARSFESTEVIRLVRVVGGGTPRRSAHYGSEPENRAERVAARELHREILPAMTARALIICEGIHDVDAYNAVAERRDSELGVVPPEGYGVRLICAGANGGGIDNIPAVGQLARRLGFRVVALVDYDNDEAEAASRLAALLTDVDAVVRLPHKHAIEEALLSGVDDADIIAGLLELNHSFSLPLGAGWQSAVGPTNVSQASAVLKSNNGLHSAFVHALPCAPPGLCAAALDAAVSCALGTTPDAHVQL